jgi:hypothetical protein
MTVRLFPRLALALVAVTAVVAWLAAGAMADTRLIPASGTASPVSGPTAPDAGAAGDVWGEFAGGLSEPAIDPYNGIVDRSLSHGPGNGVAAQSGKKAKSNPELNGGFDGLNFYQQRYSNRGNQFSVEPPDQALCVGNGYIVEAVNDVMNVYTTSGTSALPDNTATNVVSGFPRNVGHAVDLNTFYGYPAAINRSTGRRGQFVTDPTCIYDAATQRFYLVVLTLETVPSSGAFTTVNHLDLAVSQTGNPVAPWNIYRIDVTNDGTPGNTGGPCPCLGDYPHIGADANGIYITTNAYPWGPGDFDGAQIYAISKAALASGAASVAVQHIDTTGMVNATSPVAQTEPGFTVWPAQSPGTTSFDTNAGGTEYFLSSNAGDEASGDEFTGESTNLVVWALTNTSSLNSATPALTLSNTVLNVNRYAIPPKSNQPGSGTAPGMNAPQGYCINDTTTVIFTGQAGCWRLLVGAEPAHNEVVSKPDSNDTRMQQVDYANGKLWGALDTAVSFDATPANNKAGIAWYIVKPDASTGTVTAKIALQGTYGVADTNLTYPAIGVTPSGRGVVAMTAMGAGLNPSAAYAAIDAQTGLGDFHVAQAGAAPDDGFTSYKAQVGNPPRTRWGDYGAASVDGNSIWIASEYVAGACDYTAWGGPFFAGGTGDNLLGTCGGASHGPGVRAALGNWATRISKLTP